MKAHNWDTETADKCELPKFVENICEGCRDYRYCHRQLTIEDIEMEERKEE